MITGVLALTFWGTLTLSVGYGACSVLAGTARAEKVHTLDVAEFGFCLLYMGTLIVGLIALSLLQIGWFSASRTVVIALGSVVLAIAFVFARRGRLWLPKTRVTRFSTVLLGIAAVAGILFFHPDEYVLGGGTPASTSI